MDDKFVVYVMDLGIVYGPFDNEERAEEFVSDNEIEEADITQLVPPSEY